MSVKVPTTTVSPRAHRQASLSRFVAIVVESDDGIYVVNDPVRAFFPADGGVTVQGPYLTGRSLTVRGNRILNGYQKNRSGATTIEFV